MSIETIKAELKSHLIDYINDEQITGNNFKDTHNIAFNQDMYIIGCSKAEDWLKEHNISPFEAIEVCIDYERSEFGEVNKSYENAEVTVCMLAYVLGQEITPYADTWEEFKEELGVDTE